MKLTYDRKIKNSIYTIEECSSCGAKTKRAFKLGDYIFKGGDQCAKCASATMITQIAAEPPPARQ
jgi:rRNA maturation protein Nop10